MPQLHVMNSVANEIECVVHAAMTPCMLLETTGIASRMSSAQRGMSMLCSTAADRLSVCREGKERRIYWHSKPHVISATRHVHVV